ncbi:SGNH/GDSL hydrolase family protein [Nocardia camponoti]|uniref:SGNH hydrolase n=1 Tax=Nocardia camponoti TaxID=1616106 RepID=A0A917V7Z2_9NOCA|nr:SGNH/GDSL hydrolase family protein [Nocardia camponoti]GGK48161.1 SGNH hydrolase [Nocardia camponoti]
MRFRTHAIASLLSALALVALLMLPTTGATADTPPAPPGWSAAWATSLYRADKFPAPNWSDGGFSNHTLRQVVRVTEGGVAARIQLSNRHGTAPLRITGASIARSASDAAIVPNTLRPLTFGNAGSVDIQPGTDLLTDPILFPLAPFDALTVSLHIAEATGPATQHSQAIETSYRAVGDHRDNTDGAAFTETTQAWYYLSRVEVAGVAPRTSGIVTFGDSITDGVGSTADTNHRFPDELAELLAAQGNPRAVVNLGIGGNRVNVDSSWLGESARRRFAQDVLTQPGISTVIILEGINDIGLSAGAPEVGEPPAPVSADELIAGHRDLIAQARSRGLRVIGATLLPMQGSPYYSAEAEAKRQSVNHWIRTSGEYDAVIDFDTALADPDAPQRLAAAFDSGDHLHPSDAGYTAMAHAAAAVK